MRYIVDTNCLYYLSGVVETGLPNWSKIEQEIYSRDYYLALWSLVELITTDKLDETQKRKVYEFIGSKHFRIIPTGMVTKFSELIPIDLAELTNDLSESEIHAYILSEKKAKESELLRYTLIVGANVFYYALYLKLKNDGATDASLGAFSFLSQWLVTGNIDFLLERGTAIVDDKYAGEKDSSNGSKIFGLLNTLLYVLSIYHDFTVKGKPFDVFPDFKAKLSTTQLASVHTQICTNEIMGTMLDRLTDTEITSLTKIIPREYFDRAISETIAELKSHIPVGVISFSLYLVKKSFLDGRKPLKNDMIDGALFELYPAFRIITFDKKMKAIIAEFDKSLRDENEYLLKL